MTEPPSKAAASIHLDAIMPVVYEELHRIARAAMRRERFDHTLQPSALVGELYVELRRRDLVHWERRAHFFAAASEAIRNILVDHARKHNALKRGGARDRVALEDALNVVGSAEVDILHLDQAIRKLQEFDHRLGQIVHLRFFGGLTMDDVAETLGLSVRTIHTDLAIARTWLRREMELEPEA